MEHASRISAALALPPDPPGVAWIRLFACSAQFTPGEVFQSLFSMASNEFGGSRPIIASLAMQNWWQQILEQNNFRHHQNIVVLNWEEQPIPAQSASDGFDIRPFLPADLPAVCQLDNQCFEPIWQLSLESLELAYQQSAYATVGEWQGQIVAYQLSSENPFSAHLSRIAVHPNMQGRRFGYLILKDLLEHFVKMGIWQVTVNTQNTNQASLALYRSVGFQLTPEEFPVFVYNWPE